MYKCLISRDQPQGTCRQVLPVGAAGKGVAGSEAVTAACCRQSGGLPLCNLLAEGGVLPRTAAGPEALPGQLQCMGSLLKAPLLHCHTHLPHLQGRFM